MRFIFIVIAVLLSACTTGQHDVPVIVADGTEMEQFERLVFCGDSEGFTKALGDVGARLGSAWDKIEGKDSSHECTVRINIDSVGNITGHEVVTCDKPTSIAQVLETASPVPVPNNQCMFESIKGVNFSLNSTNENE